MSLPGTGTTEESRDLLGSARVGPLRHIGGSVVLAASTIAACIWLGWRLTHFGLHPIGIVILLVEVVSISSGLVVGVALARAPQPRSANEQDPRQSFRFAFAVADIVDRNRTSDLRSDLVASFRTVRRDPRRLPDLAMFAVHTDGPRRLVLVVSMTVALLIGVAPMPLPPLWAALAGVAAFASLSLSHVLLGYRRIGFGDRVRWSSASLGEIFSGTDHDDVAPRHWVGTVAAVVSLNLAIALRGISDRWTHGLTPMTAEGRLVTMLFAITIIAGGLVTLRTTTAPQLANSHLVARRTEERTARQSAIGAAAVVGVIGLLAGILPGNFSVTDQIPSQVQQVSDQSPAEVQLLDQGPVRVENVQRPEAARGGTGG